MTSLFKHPYCWATCLASVYLSVSLQWRKGCPCINHLSYTGFSLFTRAAPPKPLLCNTTDAVGCFIDRVVTVSTLLGLRVFNFSIVVEVVIRANEYGSTDVTPIYVVCARWGGFRQPRSLARTMQNYKTF